MGPIPYTTYMSLANGKPDGYKMLVYRWNKESISRDDTWLFEDLKNEIRSYRKKYGIRWKDFSVPTYMDFLCKHIHFGE